MQAQFDSLKAFDFTTANVYLWVFKKSRSAIKYKAHYVPVNADLINQLKTLIISSLNHITEFSPYGYLAQVNENSCLSMQLQGTDFLFLKTQVDLPEPECHIRNINDLKGADGYLVKFTINQDVIYAVKRSTSSWKTSYPKNFINLIFSNGELSAIEDNTFSIERNFDFFCKGNSMFIANKKGFESIVNYRDSYIQAFLNLQGNNAFSDVFMGLQPLISHIGNNSIQLRRMAVIEQKAVYSQPNFLTILQRVNLSRNWGLNFDPHTNKIILCDQTVKIVMQILLDHRLISEITNYEYDVPDAIQL